VAKRQILWKQKRARMSRKEMEKLECVVTLTLLNCRAVRVVVGGRGGISSQIRNLSFPGIFIMKSESRIDLDEHQTQCTKDL
jgi:hypothetical protein